MFTSSTAGRSFLFIFLVSTVWMACQKSVDVSATLEESTTIPAQTARVSNVGAYVPGEVIVKFKASSTSRTRTSVIELVDGAIKEQIFTNAMQARGEEQGVFLLSTPVRVEDAIARLKADDRVEYAEPNFIYQHQTTSNDPLFTNGSLWGMYGASTSPPNSFGSGAAAAWANGKTGSETVYVGIIDEGVMYTHDDIKANYGTNPGEIAGNKKDDDGNGLIDDVYGWDFAGNNNTVFDGTGDDHGTHVAGTIGAVGGNRIGVAGVCWKVKMLNAKFLGSTGGTTANAIRAVDYFTTLKLKGLNVVATNNSWGGGNFSLALYDAIERANTAGILFVAAAGNSILNMETDPSYPASYTNANIISVASITSTGALSSFSNYGSTQADLGAPGSDIISTVPTGRRTVTSGYANYSGTSMATPHVTGAVALYKSINPAATAAQIKAAILSSATPTPSLSGKCVTGGRLNVSGF